METNFSLCERVFVCVNECLCMSTVFCNMHAEGQRGINGAYLGSL